MTGWILIEYSKMAEKINLVERERGILTSHDRKYLLNQLDEELEGNAEYQKRHKIRKRVENAIYDFQILAGNLQFQDIDQLFEPAYEWARDARKGQEQGRSTLPSFPLFLDCWSSMFEFFFYCLATHGIKQSTHLAMAVIEDAIERAVRRYGFDIENKYIDSTANLEVKVHERRPLVEFESCVAE